MPDPLEVRLGSQASGGSGSAGSSGVFRNRRAPFLIANAFIQDYPDQLTDAMAPWTQPLTLHSLKQFEIDRIPFIDG
jgi:hypothetical protein